MAVQISRSGGRPPQVENNRGGRPHGESGGIAMETTERTTATTDDGYTSVHIAVIPQPRPAITALAPTQATPGVCCPRGESTVALAVNPISSVCGRAMSFTATVAGVPSNSGTIPTGTVTFSANGSPGIQADLLGGSATFTIPLDAGEHTITASYAGDSDFQASPLATLTTRIWRAGF